jgi:hypothetical protein
LESAQVQQSHTHPPIRPHTRATHSPYRCYLLRGERIRDVLLRALRTLPNPPHSTPPHPLPTPTPTPALHTLLQPLFPHLCYLLWCQGIRDVLLVGQNEQGAAQQPLLTQQRLELGRTVRPARPGRGGGVGGRGERGQRVGWDVAECMAGGGWAGGERLQLCGTVRPGALKERRGGRGGQSATVWMDQGKVVRRVRAEGTAGDNRCKCVCLHHRSQPPNQPFRSSWVKEVSSAKEASWVKEASSLGPLPRPLTCLLSPPPI